MTPDNFSLKDVASEWSLRAKVAAWDASWSVDTTPDQLQVTSRGRCASDTGSANLAGVRCGLHSPLERAIGAVDL